MSKAIGSYPKNQRIDVMSRRIKQHGKKGGMGTLAAHDGMQKLTAKTVKK